MRDHVIVFNAGSSSLKFSLFDAATLSLQANGLVDDVLGNSHLTIKTCDHTIIHEKKNLPTGYESALHAIVEWMGDKKIIAAGHRVVHGGKDFTAPIRIDNHTIAKLKELIPLAPLHQPFNVSIIEAFSKISLHTIQIACFDTAFHRTQPHIAESFALPRKYTEEGIVRYGFHGISYQYIASVLPNIAKEKAKKKVIVLHLGNGASMCAMENLQSVATSMGFTALDGLMMGTRTGSIDPGVILYLLQQKGMSADEVQNLLYKESGLKGVSGISHDMRTLEESKDPHAKEAIALFCYKAVGELGKLAAFLKGVDAIVFTGGIGEHSAHIRKEICESLEWLGVKLDQTKNQSGKECISSEGSKITVYVIPTNEEKIIAQETIEYMKHQEGKNYA